eukprot:16091-Heterococcus_DN1.PRE.1
MDDAMRQSIICLSESVRTDTDEQLKILTQCTLVITSHNLEDTVIFHCRSAIGHRGAPLPLSNAKISTPPALLALAFAGQICSAIMIDMKHIHVIQGETPTMLAKRPR